MGIRRPSKRIGLVGLALAALAGFPAAGASDPAASTGRWSAPFSEDGDGDGVGDFNARPPASRAESARLPAGVNAVALPDGRVLFWSQLDGTESVNTSISWEQPQNPRSRTRILTLDDGGARFDVPSPEHGAGGDLVGTHQVILSDGRVLVTGGTAWSNQDAALGSPNGWGRTELSGLRDARMFSATTGAWTRAADMHRARYYPSTITLPDGAVMAIGGVAKLVYDTRFAPGSESPNTLPATIRDDEVFDPVTGTWTLVDTARPSLPAFAHVHLLPNGKLLYATAGMFFPPGGGDLEAADWNVGRWFDLQTRRWSDAGLSLTGARSNAFTVMLPLRPPYRKAQILVGGGTMGPWPGAFIASPTTELITWDADSTDPSIPVRQQGPPLAAGRWHSTAVALPSGEVIALNGADRDEVIDPGSGIPVRYAEMYNPRAGRWVQLASSARDRTLHNSAILLRDGSILVGGHSPAPAHYGNHANNPKPFSSNYKDPSFEIFEPPYLFRGERPVIGSLSSHRLERGDDVLIETPDAEDETLQIVLTRLPAITHGIDNDQRTVVLEHEADADAVRARIPGEAAVVPPGHYYLFVLKDNGQGPTPSVAQIVSVE